MTLTLVMAPVVQAVALLISTVLVASVRHAPAVLTVMAAH
jgi:hypothetical protein